MIEHMDTGKKLENIRHSLAHLLAIAVLEYDPKVKLAIGPTILNGFYYDFEFSRDKTPGPEDLPIFKARMQELIKENLSFDNIKTDEKEARKCFKDQPYKQELIDEILEKGEGLTLYKTGGFVDLCRGGHVKTTKEIDSQGFSLTHIAGAYWRGNEKNIMLTRIYGAAFSSKKELDTYIQKQEEAKKRDHRKLGKELDLFTFSDMVGSGLPLWTPKGTVLRTELQNALFEISTRYDMQPVTIPHIGKRILYETSGHADKFGDELMTVISRYDEFVLKPVNCPHHIQIYTSKPRSYRDLPLRYMESTMQYRDEKPGEIGGLTRVRSITVDDGHIFCSSEHIKEEAKRIAHTVEEFYTGLGLFGNHWVSLSVRDPNTPDTYIGEPKDWDKAEEMLQQVSDELSLDAKRTEGEAAIYGPKLDYIFTDSLGREWQLATIQIDFVMPKRFKLTYHDKDGKEKTPVMLHRAILGSYERFLAILIEHFAGAFPLWLSPVQIKVLPISEAHKEYASEIFTTLKENNIRVEIDKGDETLSKKIRQCKLEKVPYFLVIGDREIKEKKVKVESRDGDTVGTLTLEDLILKLKEEITQKK